MHSHAPHDRAYHSLSKLGAPVLHHCQLLLGAVRIRRAVETVAITVTAIVSSFCRKLLQYVVKVDVQRKK
jgi:hypothetical protein